MRFKIRETGALEEIIYDGENDTCAYDIISHSDELGDYIFYDKDEDLYDISSENFLRWKTYFKNLEETDAMLRQLKQALCAKFDGYEVDDILHEYFSKIFNLATEDEHIYYQEAILKIKKRFLGDDWD